MSRSTACLLVLLGCGSGEPSWLVIDGVVGPQDRLGSDPADVVSVAREGGRLRVKLSGRRRPVRLDLKGGCPIFLTAVENAPGVLSHRTARAFLDFGPPRPRLGFDTPFTIDGRPGCAEATGVAVSWRQVTGVPLRGLRVESNGHRVHARTAAFAGADDVGWGPVPLSPRTRGAAELEARWRDGQGQTHTTTVSIAAALRATGLPHVAIGERLYVGGDDIRVVSTPDESPPGAPLHKVDKTSLSWFSALQPGAYRLQDAQKRELTVHVGQLDRVPLDCGRSGCHAAIESLWQKNPMATVLDRRWRAPHDPAYPHCALGCHTAGEPGLSDGGFSHVAQDLQVDLGDPGLVDRLPRDLRRMAGVGCVSCHGPAAIPDESDRWMALRPGVCAVCHDSPPRYGHGAAFEQTAMAKADRDPQVRTDPKCQGCHTTWGFLEKQATSAAARNAALRRPPEHAAPFGLGCVTCHDVHGPVTRSLLRVPPEPSILTKVAPATPSSSRICLPCHTPQPGASVPSATAAAIWLGRGGLDVATGGPLLGAAPHAQNSRGCLTCHNASGVDVERGGLHGFAVGPNTCKSCHPAGRAPVDLNAQARALASHLGLGVDGARPRHANARPLDLSTPGGRAAWNVLMVLEDKAAGIHNPAYARRLLDSGASVGAR